MNPTPVQTELVDEPVGIIISNGSRAEAPPRFVAFHWWPVPEEQELAVAGGNRAA